LKELIAGIIDKWQTATAITTTGPWLDVVEDANAYPFGVFSFPSNGSVLQFFGAQEEEVVVRFTVYDDNLADVATIQDALHARFDKTKLSLATTHTYHFVREGQSLRYEGVDKNGVKVYRADSIYRTKTAL
jgi:hypothetical protein